MFKKLKGAMYANDINYGYLVQKLGRSKGFYSQRFTGKRPWPLDIVYNLCDLLQIPYDEIPIYFPKGGKDNA